jgi:hypothetical protein
MNAAASIRSSLALLLEDLRLEHELQTAMGGSAGRHRNFSIAYGIGATPSQVHLAPGTCLTREAPVVLFLEGIGVACSSRRHRRFFGAGGVFESGVRRGSRRFLGEPVRRTLLQQAFAGCPNATQPEPVTVSMLFLRPRVGNWQAAYGVCPARRDFVLSVHDFCGDLSFD